MTERRTRRRAPPSIQLRRVEPLTPNQSRAFKLYREGRSLLLTGSAGTGKTLVALYLALSEVESGAKSRVHIVRSIVSSRDPGFMPGNLQEKTRVYETPYYPLLAELYDRGDAYDVLKTTGVVEFTTTSFVRGTTLRDCVIVVDELQNMSLREIDTVVTRAGENCRVICVGDHRQSDLVRVGERRGILDFTRIADRMPSFSTVTFTHADIVRSGLVREYLTARDGLGIEP